MRQLADLARAEPLHRGDPATPPSTTGAYLRFNERYRTMSVELPPESFAETRACLEARARQIPSDGETRWDQRLCDAFIEVIRSATGASGAARHFEPLSSSSSTSPSPPSSMSRASRVRWWATSSATA